MGPPGVRWEKTGPPAGRTVVPECSSWSPWKWEGELFWVLPFLHLEGGKTRVVFSFLVRGGPLGSLVQFYGRRDSSLGN